MDRRKFIMQLGAGLLGLSVSGCSKLFKKESPNFLFILADDLGWKDLGCYNSEFYETPNLNRLASQGMKFTDAYAAAPVCSPTRASIMTGKYPARINTTDWFGAPQPDNVQNHWTRNKPLLPAPYKEYMEQDEITLAEAMQKADYETFFAGKWHLGADDKYWPKKQGFDINKGGWSRGMPSPPGYYFSPYGNPRLKGGPKGEHLPNRLADETVKFIKNNSNANFMAYLSFYSVHIPLMTREELKKKYENKKEQIKPEREIWGKEGERKVRQVQNHPVYAGMVEAMDHAVGKVLDTIEELELDKNTVIFFMSDNGGLSTSEGHPTSNLPLRGGKGWIYEGGIREPMIVKWPGQTQPGSKCSEPVISTDFYPTILDIAGLPPRPEQHLDGKSFTPLLKGENMKRGPIFWHYPHYGNQGGLPAAAAREGKYKLIEFFEDNYRELYNLHADIGEKHNLIEELPQKAEELTQKLHQWRKEVDAQMPSPNPASQ
ncbi:MAG: sulfatase [Candidatus Marinimicrobia bacterium]|nr:sulfatase [Candidatus Neomarinimicrobiota bacterium]